MAYVRPRRGARSSGTHRDRAWRASAGRTAASSQQCRAGRATRHRSAGALPTTLHAKDRTRRRTIGQQLELGPRSRVGGTDRTHRRCRRRPEWRARGAAGAGAARAAVAGQRGPQPPPPRPPSGRATASAEKDRRPRAGTGGAGRWRRCGSGGNRQLTCKAPPHGRWPRKRAGPAADSRAAQRRRGRRAAGGGRRPRPSVVVRRPSSGAATWHLAGNTATAVRSPASPTSPLLSSFSRFVFTLQGTSREVPFLQWRRTRDGWETPHQRSSDVMPVGRVASAPSCKRRYRSGHPRDSAGAAPRTGASDVIRLGGYADAATRLPLRPTPLRHVRRYATADRDGRGASGGPWKGARTGAAAGGGHRAMGGTRRTTASQGSSRAGAPATGGGPP